MTTRNRIVRMFRQFRILDIDPGGKVERIYDISMETLSAILGTRYQMNLFAHLSRSVCVSVLIRAFLKKWIRRFDYGMKNGYEVLDNSNDSPRTIVREFRLFCYQLRIKIKGDVF